MFSLMSFTYVSHTLECNYMYLLDIYDTYSFEYNLLIIGKVCCIRGSLHFE